MFKTPTTTIKKLLWMSFCLLSAFSVPIAYGNYVENDSTVIGKYTVQYTVFNSQFVPPNIANTYNIVRGKDQALINISVLNTDSGKTVAADISGVAKNLIQQSKKIDFKTIRESDAVYYIGALRHTNEEIIHFTVQITIDGRQHTVKFTRKLYVEN